MNVSLFFATRMHLIGTNYPLQHLAAIKYFERSLIQAHALISDFLAPEVPLWKSYNPLLEIVHSIILIRCIQCKMLSKNIIRHCESLKTKSEAIPISQVLQRSSPFNRKRLEFQIPPTSLTSEMSLKRSLEESRTRDNSFFLFHNFANTMIGFGTLTSRNIFYSSYLIYYDLVLSLDQTGCSKFLASCHI